MRLLDWLFKRKDQTVFCPRCLGKGHVDDADIKRLNMELRWAPGACAYCNGKGKVAPAVLDTVAVNEAYLTVDLPIAERQRLFDRNAEAIMRATSYDHNIEEFIQQIRILHFQQKLTPDEIARFYMGNGFGSNPMQYDEDKKELLEYIHSVITRFS